MAGALAVVAAVPAVVAFASAVTGVSWRQALGVRRR